MTRGLPTGRVKRYASQSRKSKAQKRSNSSKLAEKAESSDSDETIESANITISNPLTIRRISTGTSESAPAVLRREREYNIIKERVEAFLLYGTGAVIYITGVPGSGKTHTVKKVFEALKISSAYVNCSKLSSKRKIFSAMGESLSCCGESSLQSLRSHFYMCKLRHIVVIDEVDFLITKNELILYNLFELPFTENARVIIIVISNTLGSLSPKTESRIGKERIEFKPYSSADLKAILTERIIVEPEANVKGKDELGAKGASTSVIPDPRSLELISKRVASSTGDIRKAMDVVSIVGGAGIDAVDAIMKEMTTPLLTKFVRSLSYYQKLILFLNHDSRNDLLEWFNSFKTFCKLKSIPEIDFISFRDVVEDLSSFGMFKMNGTRIRSQYHKEEFDQAMQKDNIFKTFL